MICSSQLLGSVVVVVIVVRRGAPKMYITSDSVSQTLSPLTTK